MAKTIVALFNEESAAESARRALTQAGIQDNKIEIEDNRSSDLSARLKSLKGSGMPERHAEAYCEGLRRGGNLVIARVEDSNVSRAQEILQQNGAVNVDQRMMEWQKTGWTGFDANSKAFNQEESMRERSAYAGTAGQGTFTLPVIEEELIVGKREVEGGGVRVHEHVTERPIEEQVTLREEHVNIERRPVDRPVGQADLDKMQDQVIDLTEKREEAVVSKQARVKEEVVINKEQSEHTETVRDTVKETDVDVEKLHSTSDTSGRR